MTRKFCSVLPSWCRGLSIHHTYIPWLLCITLWQAKLTALGLKSSLSIKGFVTTATLPQSLHWDERGSRRIQAWGEDFELWNRRGLKLKSSVSSLSMSVWALSQIMGGVSPQCRGDCPFPISPRLHLVLKHNHVSLQHELLVNHKAPERVIRPRGCLLLLEPDRLPCSREEKHSRINCNHST